MAMVLKGILLYITIIIGVMLIGAIDSMSFTEIIVGLAIEIALILACSHYLKSEDIEKLTFCSKKDKDLENLV